MPKIISISNSAWNSLELSDATKAIEKLLDKVAEVKDCLKLIEEAPLLQLMRFRRLSLWHRERQIRLVGSFFLPNSNLYDSVSLEISFSTAKSSRSLQVFFELGGQQALYRTASQKRIKAILAFKSVPLLLEDLRAITLAKQL